MDPPLGQLSCTIQAPKQRLLFLAGDPGRFQVGIEVLFCIVVGWNLVLFPIDCALTITSVARVTLRRTYKIQWGP